MSLRDRLAAGDTTLGTFLNLGSPLVAEACALAAARAAAAQLTTAS